MKMYVQINTKPCHVCGAMVEVGIKNPLVCTGCGAISCETHASMKFVCDECFEHSSEPNKQEISHLGKKLARYSTGSGFLLVGGMAGGFLAILIFMNIMGIGGIIIGVVLLLALVITSCYMMGEGSAKILARIKSMLDPGRKDLIQGTPIPDVAQCNHVLAPPRKIIQKGDAIPEAKYCSGLTGAQKSIVYAATNLHPDDVRSLKTQHPDKLHAFIDQVALDIEEGRLATKASSP
jgi:hypothetical protein